MSLAVASLAAIVVVAAPRQGWASGGGDGGLDFEIRYSDDEVEDEIETLEATPERTVYSAPTKFDTSFRPRYNFSSDWNLRASYTYSEYESAEEPTEFTADYTDPALSFQLGTRMRIRWRFPKSDSADLDGSDKFVVHHKWVNRISLDAIRASLDSDPLTIEPDSTSESAGLINMDRYEEWSKNVVTSQGIKRFLGDDSYKKLQAQFGPTAENGSAEDQSGWENTYRYCGGMCVGLNY